MLYLVAVMAGLTIAASRSFDTASDALRAVRVAAGGQAWSQVGATVAVGRETSFGLTGRYREIADRRSGFFRRRSDYGAFESAEGADRSGRWRLDRSGAIHNLDSAEAETIATTERYLARRGYLAPDSTTRARLLPAASCRQNDVCVEVTPASGKPAALWIRRSDARLDRVTIQSSPVEEIRFSNYRRVGGLLVPFRIVVDRGDEEESGATDISNYRFLRDAPAAELARPQPRTDVTFIDGTTTSTVPARVDPASGFLVVDASLDDASPAPFILDTGGHDIVTPREAHELHLHLVGAGKSFGAGAGSTPLRFARVRSVGIGTARLGPQPFTVLAIDLGRTRTLDGRTVSIAGILGLEIFERFTVTIWNRKIAFARDAGTGFCRGIPLRFTSDMPLAMASVNGAGGIFGIDTGNNVDPILFNRFLRMHAVRIRSTFASPMDGSSVGGSMALSRGRVARLRIGQALFTNLTILVSSMRSGSLSTRSEAGNIGISLLARLSSVTFDYRRHRMCLGPRA